ncbi:MAG: DUF6064 family protein [Enhygromyxa sp.]
MALQAAIPYSREAFLGVFEAYNEAVWPAPVILYLVAIACLMLVFHDRRWARRTVLALLGGLWLWTGVVYHLLYFTEINTAAWGFGALFVAQALLLFLAALGERTQMAVPPLSRSFGAIVVLYALVVYPMLAVLSEHSYPRSPTFGTPCPMVVFTFGILLLTSQSVPWWLFVIPAGWALVGAAAPFQFGIWEDFGLIVAAVLAVAILIARSRRGAVLVQSEPSPPRPATGELLGLDPDRLRDAAGRPRG